MLHSACLAVFSICEVWSLQLYCRPRHGFLRPLILLLGAFNRLGCWLGRSRICRPRLWRSVGLLGNIQGWSSNKAGVRAIVILKQLTHTVGQTSSRTFCVQVANLSALQKQLEQRVKTLGPLLSPRAQPAAAAEQKANVGSGAGGSAAPMQGVQPQLAQQQLHAQQQQQSMSQMFPAGFEATMAAMQVCGAYHGYFCSRTVDS